MSHCGNLREHDAILFNDNQESIVEVLVTLLAALCTAKKVIFLKSLDPF